MRTSYSLDLRQLLELLEDICSSDLERPVQIASTADGGMELYLTPGDGTCLLQIDVVSLQAAEPDRERKIALHGAASQGLTDVCIDPTGPSDVCAATLAPTDFSREVSAEDQHGQIAQHAAAIDSPADVRADATQAGLDNLISSLDLEHLAAAQVLPLAAQVFLDKV